MNGGGGDLGDKARVLAVTALTEVAWLFPAGSGRAGDGLCRRCVALRAGRSNCSKKWVSSLQRNESLLEPHAYKTRECYQGPFRTSQFLTVSKAPITIQNLQFTATLRSHVTTTSENVHTVAHPCTVCPWLREGRLVVAVAVALTSGVPVRGVGVGGWRKQH